MQAPGMSSSNRKANRLSNETSPYLLQHAYNPVDWFPWGEEAFQKARDEGKPVLLSIGYSTCHWCHVMERESFENEAVAEIMNAHFICIKLDREERPDIDHIYMDALQAMTGQGGWPLNIFLTHDKKPFYGGTYFPPKPLHGRPSWTDVLLSINKAYQSDRASIEKQTETLLAHLNKTNKLTALDDLFEPDNDYFHKAFNILKQSFDNEYGGYGNAPKFPSTYTTQFLLHYHYYFQNEEALHFAVHTIKQMLRGGIYDQIRGGICRYATDAAWLIPHFEKMLYDNANFIELLCDTYRITKDKFIGECLKQCVGFILNEFTSDNKLFYSAYDADSEGIEGKYYCWTAQELKHLLEQDYDWFAEYYNIEINGNWEHTNILYRKCEPKEFAAKHNITEASFHDFLNRTHYKLNQAALSRVKPSLDYKHIVCWNAMMIKSLALASIILNDNLLLEKTITTYQELYSSVSKSDGSIWHQVSMNKPSQQAVLEDYAALVEASLMLFVSCGEKKYLENAESLTQYVIDKFYHQEAQLFNYSNSNTEDIIYNKVDVIDNVICSGNAWMLSNLIQLQLINPADDRNLIINNMVKQINHLAAKYPQSLSKWLFVLLNYYKHKGEIILTGENASEEVKKLLSHFKPEYALYSLNADNDRMLFQNKYVHDASLTYYVCEHHQCRPPSNDIKKLHSEFLI